LDRPYANCGSQPLSLGPFEPVPHNPVITHRNGSCTRSQTLGHADLVEDPPRSMVVPGARHPPSRAAPQSRAGDLPDARGVDRWMAAHRPNGGTELRVRGAADPQTGGRLRSIPRSLWTLGWHTLWQPLPGMATDGETSCCQQVQAEEATAIGRLEPSSASKPRRTSCLPPRPPIRRWTRRSAWPHLPMSVTSTAS
jgi:hypothetical protein